MSTGALQSLWAKKPQAQQTAGGTAEDTAQPLKDSGNLPREKLSLAQTGSTKPLQDSLSNKDSAASEKSGKQVQTPAGFESEQRVWGAEWPAQTSAVQSSGVSSEQSSEGKKRKRMQFTLQQKEKLGAAFARTHYPTAAECLALSAETKLDKTQVILMSEVSAQFDTQLAGGRTISKTCCVDSELV